MRFVMLSLICFLFCSCVDRNIQIDSEPRGALVLLDEVKMGYTPLTVPFSHYGVREIRLEKRGYQKLTLVKKIVRPWYQAPIVSFFSDVLWPWTIRDSHFYKFKLTPLKGDSSKGLIERAIEARSQLEKEKGQ